MSASVFESLTPDQVDAYRNAIDVAHVTLDGARTLMAERESEWLDVRRVPAVWKAAGETPSQEGIERFVEALLADAPHIVERWSDSAALWELMNAKNNIEARTLLTGLLAVLEHDQGAT